MIDINLIRNEPKKVEQALAKRGFDFDSAYFLELDEKRRKLLTEIENKKAERNKASALVPQLKKEGKISTYGKYANLLKKEEYYLIIYTKEGKVAAVLSKGKERKNLATWKPDSTNNYKGCGAIGFK